MLIFFLLFLLPFGRSEPTDDQKLLEVLDEIHKLRIEVEELRNYIESIDHTKNYYMQPLVKGHGHMV